MISPAHSARQAPPAGRCSCSFWCLCWLSWRMLAAPTWRATPPEPRPAAHRCIVQGLAAVDGMVGVAGVPVRQRGAALVLPEEPVWADDDLLPRVRYAIEPCSVCRNAASLSGCRDQVRNRLPLLPCRARLHGAPPQRSTAPPHTPPTRPSTPSALDARLGRRIFLCLSLALTPHIYVRMYVCIGLHARSAALRVHAVSLAQRGRRAAARRPGPGAPSPPLRLSPPPGPCSHTNAPLASAHHTPAPLPQCNPAKALTAALLSSFLSGMLTTAARLIFKCVTRV